MRPFLARLAMQNRLSGLCRNTLAGVEVEIQGASSALKAFESLLFTQLPSPGKISDFSKVSLPLIQGESSFAIESSRPLGDRAANTPLPDLAPCPTCLAELFDPTNRRFKYPFTHCPQCGPRYTLVLSAPYDRENTAMKDFPPCGQCQTEYQNPSDRRFHCQTICCPNCGPQFRLTTSEGQTLSSGETSIFHAKQAILEGKLLAIQSVGGFHLCCRIDSEENIKKIRRLKARPAKPLALLFASLGSIQEWAQVDKDEQLPLSSSAAPIVLLRKKESSPFAGFAEAIAPGIDLLGCMLPSSPIQAILMAGEELPLVVTSCNFGDEPICLTPKEALDRFSGKVDGFFYHNREIYYSAEDSLVRVIAERTTVLRAGRGFSPFAIEIKTDPPPAPTPVIALGGHQKCSLALGFPESGKIVSLPHHGNLDTVESRDSYENRVEALSKLLDTPPRMVSDLHPGYASTQIAAQLGKRFGGCSQIQHHSAHVASCLAEHFDALKPRLQAGERILGIAWDGTGFGLDQTIWGGEFFLVTQSTIQRVGSFLPFPLPGGTVAIREPKRTLAGLLSACEVLDWKAPARVQSLFKAGEFEFLTQIIKKGIQSPQTSSVGRLFDGIAVLLKGMPLNEYEGQAAMQLEALAWKVPGANKPSDPFSFSIFKDRDSLLRVDWRPILAGVLEEIFDGRAEEQTALRFHQTLAQIILGMATRLDVTTLCLTGGCFQNKLLTELCFSLNEKNGISTFWNQRVPPGDGGLAVGQAALASFLFEPPCEKGDSNHSGK